MTFSGVRGPERAVCLQKPAYSLLAHGPCACAFEAKTEPLYCKWGTSRRLRKAGAKPRASPEGIFSYHRAENHLTNEAARTWGVPRKECEQVEGCIEPGEHSIICT